MSNGNLIVNGFSVGTDLQNVILTINGGNSYPVQDLGHLEELTARQATTQLTISPVVYTGLRLKRNIYHDFDGELTFSRYSMVLTNLILGIMTQFQATGVETYFSIYGTINESALASNGGAPPVSEFQFSQCVIDNFDFGRFSGTTEVKHTLAFRSQSLLLPNSAVNVLAQGIT